MDTGSIVLTEWVLHEVPRRRSGIAPGDGLDLSEAVAPPSSPIASFLQRRVSSAMSKGAREIVEAPEGATVFPSAVRNVFADRRTLLDASRELALHLHTHQVGSVSDGLFIFAAGHSSDGDIIAAIKLEPEDGARAKQTQDSEGRSTLTLELLTELVLTKGTKVFKVAVMHRPNDESPLMGWSVDPQAGSGPGLADFWLRQFLGCTFREKPEVTVQRLVEATETWINSHVSDPARQAQYAVALQAELTSQRTTLRVDTFAREHLEEGDRQPYRDHMREAGVPTGTIQKDLTLVKNKIARLQVRFQQGTLVLAPTQEVGETVKFDESTDGVARLSVTDRIAWVDGRRTR